LLRRFYNLPFGHLFFKKEMVGEEEEEEEEEEERGMVLLSTPIVPLFCI
jgi:hypothetical protein